MWLDDSKESVNIMQSDYSEYDKGCTIKDKNGNSVKLTKKDIKEFSIGSNEKYILRNVEIVDKFTGKNVYEKHFLRVLEEGDINLYLYNNEWIFLEKEDVLTRIENQFEVYNSNNELKYIDTLNLIEESDAKYYRDKKEYYYTLQIKMHDKSVVPSERVQYNAGSIRKQVQKYNNFEARITPLSYFNNRLSIDLNLGEAIFPKYNNESDKIFTPLVGYIEFSSPNLSKKNSIYVGNYSITSPSFFIGAKHKILINNRFQPHILFEFPHIAIGAGISYKLYNRFSISAESLFINPISKHLLRHRFGIAYKIEE